ncbi:outer membrane protein OmpA-like peptidoglycan-associated protein [Microvirga flocculans]|uniref:Outer membrane protein OmpA-like peptidoglycan-associated protein n=1 Tax=Microvirga flocculans TaxID=217168 RepID=A0A7W6IE85_9HYPH|nr:OmpA family protein [Microvirga flocculans]MBB4039862.1 outer membrane protein OmpA-like peptidoglycan-associated protein [Microvirga flocculans]
MLEEPPTVVPPGVTFRVGSVIFPVQAISGTRSDNSIDLPASILLGGFNARQEGRGLRLTLNADVLFDFDKATLRPEANEVLQNLVGEVQARLGPARYRVEGHTDGIGTDAYNDRLSARRAAAVKEWLIRHAGAGRAHVAAMGFGERRPVASNTHPDGSDDPEGRQKNRRVELVVEPLR